MRIIPFPGREQAPDEQSWQSQLEAALRGESAGAEADYWRQLRADVRALAAPMDPAFERELRERIAARSAHGGRRAGARRRLGKLRTRLRRQPRWSTALQAAGAAGIVAAVVAIALVGPLRNGGSEGLLAKKLFRAPLEHEGRAGPSGAIVTSSKAAAEAASPSAATPAASEPSSSTLATAATAAGRMQQLAASISLGTSTGEVQSTADRVAQLAVSDGGYVQSSHVQVQQQGASEASLAVRLPSAKLGAGLASLGRLAPVLAESQSLQDITDEYAAARRRLDDAGAERQALLRALSAAGTQGQIDSLRERLAANRSASAGARVALQALSRRASTAEVSVTIVAGTHAGSEGLTLHRGLHDAGHVLSVAAAVALISLAVLLPLALVVCALAAARSAWLRRRRERVLDAR